MAAILVDEEDLNRLIMNLLPANAPLMNLENYEQIFFYYFKLKYGDLAETKKNCRIWYQAYKHITDEFEKESCYKNYRAYKMKCDTLNEQIEEIKNKYHFH